jgi:hypothetical protein
MHNFNTPSGFGSKIEVQEDKMFIIRFKFLLVNMIIFLILTALGSNLYLFYRQLKDALLCVWFQCVRSNRSYVNRTFQIDLLKL